MKTSQGKIASVLLETKYEKTLVSYIEPKIFISTEIYKFFVHTKLCKLWEYYFGNYAQNQFEENLRISEKNS